MKRKSTLVDSVSAEPEVSAVGRKQLSSVVIPQNKANRLRNVSSEPVYATPLARRSQSPARRSQSPARRRTTFNFKLLTVNCILLFALFFSGNAWGQVTLTVGDNSTTNEFIPFYAYSGDTEGTTSEFIIPASELTALNGKEITALKFYLSQSQSKTWTAVYKVYMTEVATTQLTRTIGPDAGTVVYQGTVDASGSEMTITFNQGHYTYNGGNLLIGTYVATAGAWDSNGKFYGISATSAAYLSGDWGGYSTGAKDFIPKTTFTYLSDDPYITLTPASTTVLTGFTQNLTASYLNVIGTPSISYSSSNTSVATVSGSGTSATVTAVAPGTCTITATMTYQGNNYTSTCAITVEDPSYCEPGTGNYDNDGISNVTFGTNGVVVNNTVGGINYGDYSNLVGAVDAGTTGFEVAITYKTSYTYGTVIWVDWDQNYTFEGTEVVYAGQSGSSNPTTLTATFDVPANTPAGDYRMRIIGADMALDSYTGSLSNAANADPCGSYNYSTCHDYTLRVLSLTCPAPTGLTAGTPTANSVQLSWTAGGSEPSWQICVNGDEGNLVSANSNPFNLTGLYPETTYTVKVRAYCDANDQSAWSNTVTFTTDESACPKPTNVHAGNLTHSTAQITWNGNADSYTVRYRTATITGTTLDPVFEDGFESGLTGWTTYARDYDNAITNWQQYDGTTVDEGNHTGNYVAASRSWHGSVGDQHVDNWLVSPQMILGNTVKFWVATNNGYPDSYAVYVSTGSGVVPSSGTGDFTEVANLTPATGTWVEQTYDISAFAGQQGYVAIRHKDYAHDHLLIDDFGVYNAINTYSYGTDNTISPATSPCNITGLNAETLYEVSVQADCGGDGTSGWSSIYFTTPDACAAPTDLVSSNITSTTATLGWADNQDSYNLQYRKVYFYEGFEGETLPTGWTTIDANDDGNTWSIGHATAHSGSNGACNFSFIYNTTGTTPNDWLVSPQLDLQGTLRVWLSGNGIAGDQYSEHFQIYVSTTGNSAGDFTTTLVGETITGNAYVEYTADLSSYAGQRGYIAIRHFNCTDQNYLYVDDFGLYGSDNWVSVSPNPTDAAASLSGLSAGTDYEWQVQGINCNGGGALTNWSATSNFTTLYPTKIRNTNPAADEMTWEQFAGYVNGGHSYSGETVTLMENISVSGMVGTSSHPFSGTFEGDGKTITANISSSEQGAAPFRYISGATIQNLKVDGTVTSTAHHASGLVGFCADGSTNTIQNCLVSTNVTNGNAYNGDNGHNFIGGIIGHNMAATTSIIGCVYDGTITSQGFKGGMVGFGNYDSNVTITDSYFAGAYSTNGYSDPNFSPISCHGAGRNFNFTFSNFYYNTDAGTFTAPSYEGTVNAAYNGAGRAKHAYSVTGVSPVTVAMNGSPTTYNVSGITAYSTGIVYDVTIYGGDGDVLALSLDGSSCGYEIDHGNLNGSSLTMEAHNTVISAPVYTISASVNPAGTGTVSGTGSYICGATATLEATANTGYHFVNWTKNSTEVSTSATYNFTVTEAADYVANFEINTYTVTTVIHPTEGGSAEGAGTYTHGSSCTLAATANTGYQFVNWTASNGSVVSANASYTFTVTGDVTYQANFTKTTVTSLPWTENFDNGYSCSSGNWEYLHGEWATPLRWTKAACVTYYRWGAYSDPYCLEMRANNSDNMVVLPQFDEPLNKLKVSFRIGRGNEASGYTVQLGYVTAPSDASTFTALDNIATPSSGVDHFDLYTYDLSTNNNSPSSSAYRLAIKYTKSGEDSWYLDNFDVRRVYTIAVSDDPSSTASSLTGAGKYDHGATCTVTATAGDCYNFVNWTENGTEVSTSASYSFTAEADRNLVANFTQWTLNIDNNQTSLECINTGTEVVLTASATSNSTPTYEWAVSSGSTEGTASSNTYTVSPTALSNTYKVSATVGGCVVSASNTVTVKPNITNISSSEGDEVCFGLTTELAATCTDANASYSWNGGAGSGSPWTTPAITGTTNFTVVATGTNSCTVESTKSIGMKVPGNQPMTHAPEHGAIWTGYESADWSDVDNWVYFDGSYRALEGLSDTLNLILRTGDSDKCILNNPVINSPSFASNSGMIVRRPITIGEGTELNIDGDLNVESGSITFSSTGALLVTGNANIASGASVAFDNKDTLSIAGNLVLEGSLDFPESDTTPALRLGGNLVIDGGSLDEGGTLVFAGSGTQNVSNGASPLTLNNNVRLNMHRSRAGVPHTIFPDGTIFSKTTIFEYGIMDGDVTFNATGRTIVCGDYESYASGRITKIGAGNNFTFPTGDDNVLGSITAKINSGNTVHAKFHHNSADNGDGTHGFGLDVIPRWWNVADMCSDDPEPFNHVSNFEYWDISSPVELSNVILMANSATAAEHFHNPSEYTESDIQVAAFNNGCWGNFGGTAEISGSDHNVITITGAKIPKDPHRVVADFLITLGSKSHETLLPIELTSFTATCDGRSTLIEWTTATERNNDYFSLERSDDAINFTEVARVAGAGNSIEPIDYAYNDYGIHGGDNYYRLVQVDYDGTRTVSEVIVANCIEPESDGEPEVLAYPNPFSSELTVVLDNFGNRAATIEVYDMLGKLIYTNKVAAPQNSYETILNLSNLPPAAYTVRVSTNDFVINRNVVKQ